jgi:hypothetical protein
MLELDNLFFAKLSPFVLPCFLFTGTVTGSIYASQKTHQQLPKTILLVVWFQVKISHLPLPGESHLKCVSGRCI